MQYLIIYNYIFIKLYIKIYNYTLSKILNSKTIFSSIPNNLLPTPKYYNLKNLKKIKTITSKIKKIPHYLLILTSTSKL